MKRNITSLSMKAAKVEQRHVQIVLAFITLGLFVLGAGAPAAFGGGGG